MRRFVREFDTESVELHAIDTLANNDVELRP